GFFYDRVQVQAAGVQDGRLQHLDHERVLVEHLREVRLLRPEHATHERVLGIRSLVFAGQLPVDLALAARAAPEDEVEPRTGGAVLAEIDAPVRDPDAGEDLLAPLLLDFLGGLRLGLGRGLFHAQQSRGTRAHPSTSAGGQPPNEAKGEDSLTMERRSLRICMTSRSRLTSICLSSPSSVTGMSSFWMRTPRMSQRVVPSVRSNSVPVSCQETSCSPIPCASALDCSRFVRRL